MIACNWHHENIGSNNTNDLLLIAIEYYFFFMFFFFVCLVQLRLCCYCPKQRRRKKNWFKRMYNKYITMTWSARKRGEMERRNTSFMKNCARLIRCKFLESVILIDTDRLTAIDRSIDRRKMHTKFAMAFFCSLVCARALYCNHIHTFIFFYFFLI